MHQYQNYGASTLVYDGNAYTITNTYPRWTAQDVRETPYEAEGSWQSARVSHDSATPICFGSYCRSLLRRSCSIPQWPRLGEGTMRSVHRRRKQNGATKVRLTQHHSVPQKNSRTSVSTAAEADLGSDTSASELTLDNG
jgi:hypothetical protein